LSRECHELDKLDTRVAIFRLVLALSLVCLAPRSGFSGQAGPPSDASTPFERGTVEISLLGGTSLPVPAFRADPDDTLALVSLQIGRVMTGGANGNNLQLILDAAPFIHVRQLDAVRGWAVSPLFVRWNFPPAGERGVRIFGEFSGGLLFTSDPVPARTTTTFNFLDQAGFGVRIEERAGRAWLAGYRFQHVSNGGRAKPNPGVNFNFVYLGVSFVR
jgi:hypothetical protein